MQLDRLLERCHGLEQRAAGVYRTFALASRPEAELCALWTELAREEEQHAASVARARGHLRQSGDPRISLDGWEESIGEVEARLATAERLGAGATLAQQLAAALELEMTEIDTFRRVALAAAHAPDPDEQVPHAEKLAKAAEALTDDPQVRLQIALLRARARIQR